VASCQWFKKGLDLAWEGNYNHALPKPKQGRTIRNWPGGVLFQHELHTLVIVVQLMVRTMFYTIIYDYISSFVDMQVLWGTALIRSFNSQIPQNRKPVLTQHELYVCNCANGQISDYDLLLSVLKDG